MANGHSLNGIQPDPLLLIPSFSTASTDSTLPSLSSSSSPSSSLSLALSDHASIVGLLWSASSSSLMANIDPVLCPPSSVVSDDAFSLPALSANLDTFPSVDPPVGPPCLQTADASTNPCHVTQLWPIFVKHVAHVHEWTEKKYHMCTFL